MRKVTAMNNKKLLFGFGAAMAVIIASTTGCSKATAQAAPTPESHPVELTIYTGGFAMVSEHRPAHLTAGRNKVVLDGISKMLDASSILVDWPKGTAHPEVIGTTYDLDKSDGNSLIHRLNGKKVELMWPSTNGTQGETVSGRLETSGTDGTFALRTPERLYINPTGTLIAPSDTPSGLPVLSVQVNSVTEANTQMGVSYLSGGMNWKADYVAKISPNSETADVECWASIDNKTGTSYPDAHITLVAGQPNAQVESGRDSTLTVTGGVQLNHSTVVGGSTSNGSVALRNAPRMELGDMYAYKISSLASVSNDQTNRVSVLGTRTVPINRSYSISVPEPSELAEGTKDGTNGPRLSAESSIAFMNVASSNLGIPLPGGQVRVYERDASGAEQFVGSDGLTDTTKGSHVRLNLATAFDVFGSAKVVSKTSLPRHHWRYVVEASVSNERKVNAPVLLSQPMGGVRKLISESTKGESLSASMHQWRLVMKPGETRKITYTLEM